MTSRPNGFSSALLHILIMAFALPGVALAAGSYAEDFSDTQAQGWTTSGGTFTASPGYYTNDDDNTNPAIAVYGGKTWNTDYSYRARLYCDHGAVGNTLGLIYNHFDDDNYYEVRFNSRGDVTLNKRVGGSFSEVATGTYTGFTSDTWFNVEILRTGTQTTVKVNGATIFANVVQTELGIGKIGVFTRWNFGRFDDIKVAPIYAENFDDGAAQAWSSSGGTYSVQSNYYKNDFDGIFTSAVHDGSTWGTDFTYNIRVLSGYGASGNVVGVIYNYLDSNNYYEVWANALGTIGIRKVIAGSTTSQGQSTYDNFGQTAWFNVQIVRNGTTTSVRVNGEPIFTDISQPELSEGKIGVTTRWNLARFDDITVTPNAFNTAGPPFPRIGTVRIGGPHNYDQLAVRQEISRAHVALLNYWVGWDNGKAMTMNQVAQSIKSLHPDPANPTKVFLYTNIGEFNDNPGQGDTSPLDITNKLTTEGWWLLDANGNRVPSTYKPASFDLVNITSYVPLDSTGKDFSSWFANWIYTNYYQPNTSIDGFFTDNVFWKPRRDGDWDRNGTNDLQTNATVQSWFRSGLRQYVGSLRRLMPNTKLQIGNVADWNESGAVIAPQFPGLLQGGVIEHLVGPQSNAIETWAGWSVMMQTYRKVMNASADPKLVIFHHNSTTGTDYQSIRYGLGSCLLDDGYFYTSVNNSFNTTNWYDEFDSGLGYPTAPPSTTAWQNGVYRRDFQNGIVLVNPKGNGVRTVTVGNGFRHLSGNQAPTVNNGQTVTSVTLQDRDAVILIRQ